MEEIEKELSYTKTKTHIRIRYGIAIFMILLYPALHFLMAYTEAKFPTDFIITVKWAAGLGLFLFFEPQIQRMMLLIIKWRREQHENYKIRIVAEHEYHKKAPQPPKGGDYDSTSKGGD